VTRQTSKDQKLAVIPDFLKHRLSERIRFRTPASSKTVAAGVKFDNLRVILTIDTPLLCHFFRTIPTLDFSGQVDAARWKRFA